MKKLNEVFDVIYGNKLDLNKMTHCAVSDGGVNFVGRSSQNHGVSATVTPLPDVPPYKTGRITVALGGSKLLSSFVQEQPFYTAQNVAVLSPKEPMTFAEKLFTCLCIRHNRFRYSAFGREANRTLRSLPIPDKSQFPDWVKNQQPEAIELIAHPAKVAEISLESLPHWKSFELQSLFNIERGKGPRRKDLDGSGTTPFVTSTDSNNGVTGYTS